MFLKQVRGEILHFTDYIVENTEINAQCHEHTGLGGPLLCLDQCDVVPLQHDSPQLLLGLPLSVNFRGFIQN